MLCDLLQQLKFLTKVVITEDKMSSRISFNEMSNFSTDTKLTHTREGDAEPRQRGKDFISFFSFCLFNHLWTDGNLVLQKKSATLSSEYSPRVPHPQLQTRPLGQVEKRNVMLTFSVFCNWWICFYLQYRFTITTSTNIFITPQDQNCLTANHHKNTINIEIPLT